MTRVWMIAPILCLSLLAVAGPRAQRQTAVSCGDQGNGRYRNPVLKADCSDPDVIRHGDEFGWVGVSQDAGARRIVWNDCDGPALTGTQVWLRGVANGTVARLFYALDGRTFVDTGKPFELRFKAWKGSRLAIFSYGADAGAADFDYVRYRYHATLDALGVKEG
jgi:hypothetical protein